MKAPEHPFPKPVIDSYSSFEWLASDDAIEKIPQMDLNHVVLIGESAGANISLVLATLKRDNLKADFSPAIPEMVRINVVAIVAMFPVLFLPYTTKSLKENPNAFLISGFFSDFILNAYLPGSTEAKKRAEYVSDRRCNPLMSPNGVADLPLVVVMSGGLDGLNGDAYVLEEAVRQADGQVVHYHDPKGIHSFHKVPFFSKKAQEKAQEFLVRNVNAVLPTRPKCVLKK